MKKILAIFVFLFLLFGLVPSIKISSENLILSLKTSYQLNAFNELRDFTQQHSIFFEETQGMVNEDGSHCLREYTELVTFESCSPGLEPCGADHEPHISGWGATGWDCYDLEY